MKLPNAAHAVVEIAKLRDYSLNPHHAEGKHKARVFQAVLGFSSNDAELLREMIFAAITVHDALEERPSPYGRRFAVDFPAGGRTPLSSNYPFDLDYSPR